MTRCLEALGEAFLIVRVEQSVVGNDWSIGESVRALAECARIKEQNVGDWYPRWRKASGLFRSA